MGAAARPCRSVQPPVDARAVRVRASGAKRVWAYFNNDGGGNAVRNAHTLRAVLGV